MRNDATTARVAKELVTAAAAALKARIEEVNRLNVFPVPDGDTGINMSLTMDTVVRELTQLSEGANLTEACHAVSHGSLMGARGNSGVILSQILRGLCEGVDSAESVDAQLLAATLERAVTVSFQAVRKPVEGTMLTVIRDVAEDAKASAEQGLDLDSALERVSQAAFDSVRRTPELLPVLKENGVVDAGGFGLAILIEGFTAAAVGRALTVADVSSVAAPLLTVEPADDWDDQEYLYCTEFLLFAGDIDQESVHDYLVSVGGSELIVGTDGEYKVHVHTNDPAAVLGYATALGEVSEVHINNMRRQQAVRDQKLSSEPLPDSAEKKPLGIVAVASGEGLADILKSLGVDVVVGGGQTMNPATEDLLDAVGRVPAESVIILPNNKNILMAANAAASVASKPVGVVPTRSIPAAFAALLAFDGSADLEQVVEDMSEAAGSVRTGEITFAVKDAKGKVGQIKAGQVIGIIDDENIEAVGDDVDTVALQLVDILASDAETITVFAGFDYTDAALECLVGRIGELHPDIEVEAHRGDQPLYPLLLAAE